MTAEDIPCFGTTHADYFYDSIPCARHLTQGELEEVAKMAILTRQMRATAGSAPQRYQDKHYFRKHGPGACYGQR